MTVQNEKEGKSLGEIYAYTYSTKRQKIFQFF